MIELIGDTLRIFERNPFANGISEGRKPRQSMLDSMIKGQLADAARTAKEILGMIEQMPTISTAGADLADRIKGVLSIATLWAEGILSDADDPVMKSCIEKFGIWSAYTSYLHSGQNAYRDIVQAGINQVISELRAMYLTQAKAAPPSAGESQDEFNETITAAAEFIRTNPGKQGRAVATHCNIEYGTFRSHVVPTLKKLGFYNKKGKGYLPPKTM
jgi:hypothetical protein